MYVTALLLFIACAAQRRSIAQEPAPLNKGAPSLNKGAAQQRVSLTRSLNDGSCSTKTLDNAAQQRRSITLLNKDTRRRRSTKTLDGARQQRLKMMNM
jgi:hypothetical protein